MATPSTPASQTLDETDSTKTQESFSKEDDNLFLAVEDYCWEDDPEFHSGLTQILTTASSTDQVRQLTRQAKCFFYSRKISRQISFPLYSAWLDREESSGPRCRSPSCEVGPPTEPTPIEGNPVNELKSVDPGTSPTAVEPVADQKKNTEGGRTSSANIATGGQAGKEDDKTPYPISFAEIVELITSGKPVPGIREISNTLNTAPPSQSTTQRRKKPWEVAAEQPQVSPTSIDGGLPSPAPTPEN